MLAVTLSMLLKQQKKLNKNYTARSVLTHAVVLGISLDLSSNYKKVYFKDHYNPLSVL